jgi:hypothetical protein
MRRWPIDIVRHQLHNKTRVSIIITIDVACV